MIHPYWNRLGPQYTSLRHPPHLGLLRLSPGSTRRPKLLKRLKLCLLLGGPQTSPVRRASYIAFSGLTISFLTVTAKFVIPPPPPIKVPQIGDGDNFSIPLHPDLYLANAGREEENVTSSTEAISPKGDKGFTLKQQSPDSTRVSPPRHIDDDGSWEHDGFRHQPRTDLDMRKRSNSGDRLMDQERELQHCQPSPQLLHSAQEYSNSQRSMQVNVPKKRHERGPIREREVMRPPMGAGESQWEDYYDQRPRAYESPPSDFQSRELPSYPSHGYQELYHREERSYRSGYKGERPPSPDIRWSRQGRPERRRSPSPRYWQHWQDGSPKHHRMLYDDNMGWRSPALRSPYYERRERSADRHQQSLSPERRYGTSPPRTARVRLQSRRQASQRSGTPPRKFRTPPPRARRHSVSPTRGRDQRRDGLKEDKGLKKRNWTKCKRSPTRTERSDNRWDEKSTNREQRVSLRKDKSVNRKTSATTRTMSPVAKAECKGMYRFVLHVQNESLLTSDGQGLHSTWLNSLGDELSEREEGSRTVILVGGSRRTHRLVTSAIEKRRDVVNDCRAVASLSVKDDDRWCGQVKAAPVSCSPDAQVVVADDLITLQPQVSSGVTSVCIFGMPRASYERIPLILDSTCDFLDNLLLDKKSRSHERRRDSLVVHMWLDLNDEDEVAGVYHWLKGKNNSKGQRACVKDLRRVPPRLFVISDKFDGGARSEKKSYTAERAVLPLSRSGLLSPSAKRRKSSTPDRHKKKQPLSLRSLSPSSERSLSPVRSDGDQIDGDDNFLDTSGLVGKYDTAINFLDQEVFIDRGRLSFHHCPPDAILKDPLDHARRHNQLPTSDESSDSRALLIFLISKKAPSELSRAVQSLRVELGEERVLGVLDKDDGLWQLRPPVRLPPEVDVLVLNGFIPVEGNRKVSVHALELPRGIPIAEALNKFCVYLDQTVLRCSAMAGDRGNLSSCLWMEGPSSFKGYRKAEAVSKWYVGGGDKKFTHLRKAIRLAVRDLRRVLPKPGEEKEEYFELEMEEEEHKAYDNDLRKWLAQGREKPQQSLAERLGPKFDRVPVSNRLG